MVRAAAGDHVDVQGLCRAGPTPHGGQGGQHLERALQPRQHSGAAVGEPAEGVNVGELTLRTLLTPSLH